MPSIACCVNDEQQLAAGIMWGPNIWDSFNPSPPLPDFLTNVLGFCYTFFSDENANKWEFS